MKTNFLAFASAAVMLASCGATPKQAAEFNDQLMAHQKNVVIKYDELLETYDTYVPEKMDNALINFTDAVENALRTTNDIVVIDGGDDLKEAMISYLTVYLAISKEDAAELVRLYKLPENEFTPELKVKWDSKYKDMDNKIKAADKELQDAQTAFASKFKLKII